MSVQQDSLIHLCGTNQNEKCYQAMWHYGQCKERSRSLLEHCVLLCARRYETARTLLDLNAGLMIRGHINAEEFTAIPFTATAAPTLKPCFLAQLPYDYNIVFYLLICLLPVTTFCMTCEVTDSLTVHILLLHYTVGRMHSAVNTLNVKPL